MLTKYVSECLKIYDEKKPCSHWNNEVGPQTGLIISGSESITTTWFLVKNNKQFAYAVFLEELDKL